MTRNPLTLLLALDDPDVVRAIMKVLASEPQIRVLKVASDRDEAVRLTLELGPDAVLIAPRLNGWPSSDAIEEIMIERPTPVLIVPQYGEGADADASVLALKAGALAVLRPPDAAAKGQRGRLEREFVATIAALAQVRLVRRWRPKSSVAGPVRPPPGADAARVIAIGASTGGPAAVLEVLQQLTSGYPLPILVVQHISNGFIASVASWLNDTTALRVKVAEDRERLRSGTVYMAPDDCHLGVTRGGAIHLSDAAPIAGFRPSATFLFESVADSFGENALAVILTGMGRDGVEGLRTVRARGGRVIAQSEGSSIVFGMPGAAVEQGLAEAILAPDEIGRALVAAAQEARP